MRQKRQRPFCTSVYRQAIFDLLVHASGAEDECHPPHGSTARVLSAAGCTVSVYKPIEASPREHSSQIKLEDRVTRLAGIDSLPLSVPVRRAVRRRALSNIEGLFGGIHIERAWSPPKWQRRSKAGRSWWKPVSSRQAGSVHLVIRIARTWQTAPQERVSQ